MISAIEAKDISNKFYNGKIQKIITDIEQYIKENAKEGKDGVVIRFDKRNEKYLILFINVEEVRSRIIKILDDKAYVHQYYIASENIIELTIKW